MTPAFQPLGEPKLGEPTVLYVRCTCGKDLGTVPGYGVTGVTNRPCEDCCGFCGRKVGAANLDVDHLCPTCVRGMA